MKDWTITRNKVGRVQNTMVFLTVLLAILLAPQIQAQPAARMGVSPQRYHIDFGGGGSETQSLMVQNLTDQPLTVKLSVNYWELDESNQVRILPPEEDSLDGWIVINPLRVTIPPGSPQTIRWAVMPRLKPENKEYRAMIFIEEELQPRDGSEGTNLRVKMRYGIPIYAGFGNPEPEAILHSVGTSGDGKTLRFDLTNEGNAHGRMAGHYGVWPADTFPGETKALQLMRSRNPDQQDNGDFFFGQLPDSAVLPGYRRTLAMNINLPQSGEYILQLDARFAQLTIKDAIQLEK